MSFIGNEEDFINYLIRNYVKVNGKNDHIISLNCNDVNFSGNDTYNNFVWDGSCFKKETCIRPLIILNGENRIVNVHDYENKIREKIINIKNEYGSYDAFIHSRYQYNRYVENQLEYGDVLVHKGYKENVCYRFRIDPVPNIHNYKGGPYQHKKYRHIIAMIKNPENKGYIRKSHYDSIIQGAYDWEDYNIRNNSRSWKNNKKCKKQWQKHII